MKSTAVALTLALLLTTPTLAQDCDPAIQAAADAAAKRNAAEEAERLENIYKGHIDQPDWLKNSDGLLTACTSNNWPVPKVSSPLLGSLLSKAAERAAKMACDKARSAISSATASYEGVLGSIDGFEGMAPTGGSFGNWPEAGTGNLLPDSGSSLGWSDLGSALPPGTIPEIPGITQGGTASIPGITPGTAADPIP